MSDEGFLSSADGEENDEPEVIESQVVDSTPEEQKQGVVKPVDDLDEVAGLYEKFEEIKEKIIDSNDLVTISGEPHVTKSGWRKIATAFNVSTEMVESEKEVEMDVIHYTATVRAEAPNGKTVTGTGMASSNESNFMEFVADPNKKSEDEVEKARSKDDVMLVDGNLRRLKDPRAVNHHNLLALAETRAKNRAISDLVGGGEVSAEEMGKDMVF